MDGEKLRYGFLNNHATLIARLSTTSILPYVYSEGLITSTEKDLIQHEPSEGIKTDKLLDIIHRLGNSNYKVYTNFFNLLADDSVTSGQQLEPVLEKIKKDSFSEEVWKKFKYERRFLEEDDSSALKRHKWAIVQSLSVDELLPELVTLGVVSLSEKAEIKSESTPNHQALKLITFIEDHGSQAFNGFVSALLDSDRHKHLGEMLRKSADNMDPCASLDQVRCERFPVEEVLKRGHVPPRQGVYVERKEMIEKIRNALYHLKDKEGWVLVHGMAGFGKTVLAAEAVRDAKILEEVFPGGVNWVTVGKMSDHNGDVDRGMLLSKLQALILRLDRTNVNRQIPSVESATDYLQEIIADQYPRSLLILDDVWSHEVVQAFSVRCRTLVTSRVVALISPVLVKNVHSVSVSDGFSEEEGKLLLSQWLGKSPEELSSHSDSILEYCRGSPMAIALIGAMLRKNSNEKKWEAIANKMEKKHLHLSTKISNWSYEHPTLNASIELSVESLPEDQKKYFEMLAVFEYDISIPIKVLETIWDVDNIDAEDYINTIADYSLAHKCVMMVEDTPPFYYIHDIILDYLKGSISKEEQRQFHWLVVERYEKKCEGSFSDLEDDSYVFKRLMGHIISAGNFELLGDLMTQLKWLISSVIHGDANLLLAHYRDYKTKVPQNFQVDVQKFELFLSGHMYVLANSPKRDDILQLALLQPDDSELYCQASSIIHGERKKSWFKWSNKDSDPEKYALKLKLHEDSVNCCQFSGDGEKVLSCAGTEIKLWESSTGTVLGHFKGHKDRVTCCALSAGGRVFVSSSEDCTVKVWETRTQRLVCDFTQHRYGVQCCALSPDGKWVVSADIDSVIILWDVLLGKVLKSWRLGISSPALTPTPENANQLLDFSRSASNDSAGGGQEGVLCCNFSPDGTVFATASQNGIIRLWNLSSFSVIFAFQGHSSLVKCCVFSKNGCQLASASLDCTAKVWDVSNGMCIINLNHGDECAVLSCDFSQDGSRLITGNTWGSVKVWSLPHGILLQDLPLHWDYVNCVLYSPKTQNILSAADNGIIKILWSDEIEEENQHSLSAVQYHRRFSTHFIKEGSKYEPVVLCYIHKDNKLQIVKGSKADVINSCLPTVPGSNPRCWVFSNAGDKIVVGYVQGTLQLMHLKGSPPDSALEEWHLNAHDREVLKCYFSLDDTKIVSCCYKEHKIWSVATGELIAAIAGRGIGVRPSIFLDDSTRIVSIQESCVLLWNSDNGSPLTTFQYNSSKGDNILCVNLSKDNKRLIASATNGLVLVWSITGDLLMESEVMPLSPCARSCALSPDGRLAVAGFDDGSLKIWNVDGRFEVTQQYTGSDYWMVDVSFSPDGSKIVTLCDSIEWWRTDGTHVKRVILKGTFGKYIRFSPDFETFVTIDNAGLLYILTTVK